MGRQGKGKPYGPLQEHGVIPGANEERSRRKSQLGLWEKREGEGGRFDRQYKDPFFSYPITACLYSPKLTTVVHNNYRPH